MNYEPKPREALFLWRVITAETAKEREPKLNETRPKFSKKQFELLIHAGFVRLEPRGRATVVVLTDAAWSWASDAIDVELLKSQSAVGAEALQGLLRRLLPFLKQHDLPLASLFSVASERPSVPPSPPPGTSGALAKRIEAVCLSLAGNKRQTRVKLSALRRQLSSVERGALDRELLKLQDERRLVLYREDNSAALSEDDRDAAVLIGNEPRHLVLLEA